MFCANCQAETEHTASIQDTTGEVLMECPCGRVLKFPKDITKEQLAEYEEAHAANKGQISKESLYKVQEAKLAELFPDAPNSQPSESSDFSESQPA